MSLQCVLGAVAVLVVSLLAMSIPLGMALHGYGRIAATLDLLAIAEVAAEAPSRGPDASVRWETRDAAGDRVAAGGAALEWPMLERVVALPATPRGPAQLRLSKSLRPLLVEVALLVLGFGAAGIAVGVACKRLVLRRLDRILFEQRAENLRFHTAIDNISQGLCFFDGQHRLIVCNRRYAEMYGLAEEVVRPGTSLRQIVDARFEAGT